jgi:hypothetical protein
MSAFREFLLILVGAFIGAALGAGFGALVGLVSPEFVEALAYPQPINSPERLGTAMGMIAGLLLGAAAMAVGRLVGAARQWATSGRSAEASRATPDAAAEQERKTGFTRPEGIARGPGR